MVESRLPERIVGPRIVLQRWTVGDAPVLQAAVERNLEHLGPWMPWIVDEPLSIDRRIALLEEWDRLWRDGGDVAFAIQLDGAVAGSCGLHHRRGPGILEIGYWVDKDQQGHGIATEAASLLTSTAFSRADVSFVEIHPDRANVRSRRIPERLGYAFQGEVPDDRRVAGCEGVDCNWRITRGEWMERAQESPDV